MKWLCRYLGHKFDIKELTVLDIKLMALNRTDLKKEIKCMRCGRIFCDGVTMDSKITRAK